MRMPDAVISLALIVAVPKSGLIFDKQQNVYNLAPDGLNNPRAQILVSSVLPGGATHSSFIPHATTFGERVIPRISLNFLSPSGWGFSGVQLFVRTGFLFETLRRSGNLNSFGYVKTVQEDMYLTSARLGLELMTPGYWQDRLTFCSYVGALPTLSVLPRSSFSGGDTSFKLMGEMGLGARVAFGAKRRLAMLFGIDSLLGSIHESQFFNFGFFGGVEWRLSNL